MKFGRFHAVALLALGTLLLLGQAYISIVANGNNDTTMNSSRTDSSPKPGRGILPVFGIMGGLILACGVVIFVISPHKTLSEEVGDIHRI